jgi:hypothetical protein
MERRAEDRMQRLDVDATGDAARAGEVRTAAARRHLPGAGLLATAVSTAVIISGLNGLVQIIRVIVDVSTEHPH